MNTSAADWPVALAAGNPLIVVLVQRCAGDNVRWQSRVGGFRRDVDDGEHAEIVIGERIYKVRARELG